MYSGPDKGGYYHELFLKGKADLVTKIPRMNVKGEGPRKPSSSKNKPNLYELPSLSTAVVAADSKQSATPTRQGLADQDVAAAPRNTGSDVPQDSLEKTLFKQLFRNIQAQQGKQTKDERSTLYEQQVMNLYANIATTNPFLYLAACGELKEHTLGHQGGPLNECNQQTSSVFTSIAIALETLRTQKPVSSDDV